jgi:hypothetical protein
MGFKVVYDAPADLLAKFARGVGDGQRVSQQREQLRQEAIANERFLLGLNEQQRQFDTSTAFRAQEADRANAARQQQMGQQAAAQQAALLNNQQARAANIYGQELDYANAQQNRDAEFQLKGVDSMEQMAKDALLAANKMKLDPQGQRKLAELSADFRAIAAQRGVGIRDGDAYGGVLGDWLSDFNNSGLEDHEQVEPTPDELWQQGTRTGDDGTVYGLDRNGTWRKLKDPPPRPLTPEEIQQNTHRMPTGETMFVNPLDGKPYFSTPQKPEADPNAFTQESFLKEEAAILALARERAYETVDGKSVRRPVDAPDLEWARKQYESRRAERQGVGEQELQPHFVNRPESQVEFAPDGIPIAPDPATAATWPQGTMFYTPDGRKKVVGE